MIVDAGVHKRIYLIQMLINILYMIHDWYFKCIEYDTGAVKYVEYDTIAYKHIAFDTESR